MSLISCILQLRFAHTRLSVHLSVELRLWMLNARFILFVLRRIISWVRSQTDRNPYRLQWMFASSNGSCHILQTDSRPSILSYLVRKQITLTDRQNNLRARLQVAALNWVIPLSSLGSSSIKTEFSLVNNPLTVEEGGSAKLFNLTPLIQLRVIHTEDVK